MFLSILHQSHTAIVAIIFFSLTLCVCMCKRIFKLPCGSPVKIALLMAKSEENKPTQYNRLQTHSPLFVYFLPLLAHSLEQSFATKIQEEKKRTTKLKYQYNDRVVARITTTTQQPNSLPHHLKNMLKSITLHFYIFSPISLFFCCCCSLA